MAVETKCHIKWQQTLLLFRAESIRNLFCRVFEKQELRQMAITATQNGVRDHGIQTDRLSGIDFELSGKKRWLLFHNEQVLQCSYEGVFLSVKNDDKNKDRLDKFAMETVSRMFVINEWMMTFITRCPLIAHNVFDTNVQQAD